MNGSVFEGEALYAAPAILPVSVAEAKLFGRIDSSSAEPAPGSFTAALASPAAVGNVDNGAHRWLATFVTADGETEAGAASAAVTVADKSVNGQVALTGIPIGGADVTSRKLYRTAAAGSSFLLLATLADNTTTAYTDNIADSALGAGAPAANSTGDPLLSALLGAAVAHAEHELGRRLITQTRDYYFRRFPCGYLDLAGSPARYQLVIPPAQSVSAITYVDADGATQTLSSAAYLASASSGATVIEPAYGYAWPAARDVVNAIKVRAVVGYGAARSSVPECIRHWILLRTKTLWDNREQIASGAGGMVEIPPSFVDGLLDQERVWGKP